MHYQRLNTILGWCVCLIACTVYILTSEAGGSFWDCGEFVSSCFKLQIPHPPGAPFFILLGRIFIVMFGNDGATAAKAVNIMSALASGFTILFLFWTITHFARKIVQTDLSKDLSPIQTGIIMAAGTIGALAGTFTDSFWFSAVEGEVYAMSSFFTAIVFWSALKWEQAADEPAGDKWLIFIFFMIGLSIGVHLLCLLCIPAIVMVYYCRRRASIDYVQLRKYFLRTVLIGGGVMVILFLFAAQSASSPDKAIPMDGTWAGLMLLATMMTAAALLAAERFRKDRKEYYGGMFIFLVIGVVLFGLILKGVIQYSIRGAGIFDVFFVNDLHMPFYSGFTFFFLMIALVIHFGVRIATRKNAYHLRLALWCIAFTLLGYSTYLTTLIRSNADPSIDLFNVDNPETLEGYLGREEYGDFPILYGENFTAQPVDYREGSMKYEKGKDRYMPAGRDLEYVFLPADKRVFPRMWDMSNQQQHADYYAFFLGIGKNPDGTYERSPTAMENLKFFLSYQTYYMYIRYFLWNFSGRQNDLQGIFTGNVRDGNWITGIPVIDNALYGDQKMMPDSLQQNKAHNTLFMLPFALGLIGMFYHFHRKGGDALVNLLLFISTGFAIVIYINQPGFQPRERDYAYAGSFYAFAIWIGLSVLYFIELATTWNRRLLKDILVNTGIVSLILALLLVIAGYGGGAAFTVGIATCLLLTVIAAAVPYILKWCKNPALLLLTTLSLLLLVPVSMALQEWDDHDRSKKVLARDMARDYLESCAPNAILFTMGDNDTYPLWYAQEVEGIRPDVRIIITTLLGSDWFMDQLRRKVNNSEPVDVIWRPEQVQGHKRDYIFYQPQPQFPDNRYYDLYDMMKNWVGSDAPATMVQRGDEQFNTFPVRKVSIPVDTDLVRSNGTVTATDTVLPEMRFELPAKNILMKNELAILNIIAANKWKRPIYFTMPYDDLGFGDYLRRDGLCYRLAPVKNPGINTEKMYALISSPQKWGYGNANLPGVYFDEENRRHLLDIRKADLDLAFDLIFKNRKEDATKILERDAKMIAGENLPFGMTSRYNLHDRISVGFLEACYRAGDRALAATVLASVKKDLEQQKRYYNALDTDKQGNLQYEKATVEELLNDLTQMEQTFGATDKPIPAQQ